MPYVYGILHGGHDTPWGLRTDLVVKVRQVIIEAVSKAKKRLQLVICVTIQYGDYVSLDKVSQGQSPEVIWETGLV